MRTSLAAIGLALAACSPTSAPAESPHVTIPPSESQGVAQKPATPPPIASSGPVPTEPPSPASTDAQSPDAEPAQPRLEPFSSTPDNRGPWGYRDRAGRVVIAPRYQVAFDFQDGLGLVTDSTGAAYIDETGKVVGRPYNTIEGPDSFQEGLVRFESQGKIGFFDRSGRMVVPARYDYAEPFTEGLAAVCQGCTVSRAGRLGSIGGGLWGFVDKTGRLVIPCQFEHADGFENGRSTVRLRGREMTIDRSGREVKP